MIYLLLLLFVIPLIFHIATRYSRRGKLYNNIPGPIPYPIVGNILMFNLKTMHELFKKSVETMKKYYPITRVWACTSAIVLAYHPDDLEVLLSSQNVIDKGYVYDYLQPWLKTGLLTSGGDKWRQRRKILTPAFHFNILKKYLAITNEEGEKCIKNLESEGKESIQNLELFCSNCTLNIICESAMGVALDEMGKKTIDEYKKAVHDMGQVAIYRLARPYIQNYMLPFVYKIGSMQRNALKILHNFSAKVIKNRKELHQSTGNKFLKYNLDDDQANINEDEYIGRKKRLAMLDLLLSAQQNGLIDDNGIQEEVDTFTFEGHDTTGMALTYALLLLAENKEAQVRARAEVNDLLNKTNGRLEMADLQELSYLERCIKESLRLYPPVSGMLRYTNKDIQLANALVPADTHIIIFTYVTHRDPNFWTEPDKFDPDRFLPENSKNRHPFSYVPFSAGPRNCIGQKFAMLEMKSILSRILHRFYLEPIDKAADMKLNIDLVLRPQDPVHLKFIRINK